MFMNKKNNKRTPNEIVSLTFDKHLETIIDNNTSMPTNISEIKESMRTIFSDSFDFTEREFRLPNGKSVYLAFFSGLINGQELENTVIRQLLNKEYSLYQNQDIANVLTLHTYITPKSWKEITEKILHGNVLLVIDELKPVILYLSQKNIRSISNPTTEYQVYGAKIGFIEDSKKNISIIRQFLQDPRLKTKEYKLGNVSETHTAIVYLEQYVDPQTITTLNKHLTSFDRDHLLTLGQLTKYVSKHPYSIFPQAQKTERPDTVSYALTQGKIALFIDNSAFCLLAPITFMDMLETSEDHANLVTWNLTFVRLLRLFSLLIGTSLPALYVALVAFQPELIPTTLTINIAQSRAQIPLPATAEAFLMLFALDILVEASIRLPSFVGQTIGIVGGLVIGTAAVEAGIVSNVMVIVISFTALAIFTLPNWEFVSSWRIVRYFFVVAAAFLGLYGLVLAIGFLALHVAKIESLNKSYLYPLSPFDGKQMKNFFKPGR